MWACLSVLMLLLLAKVSCDLSPAVQVNDVRRNFTEEVRQLLQRNDSALSNECRYQLSLYIESLDLGKLWAAKMYDANAKLLLSGVLGGNLVDFGSFDECLDIDYHMDVADVVGKYCIADKQVYIPLEQDQTGLIENRKIIKVKLGKCFPAACKAKEMQEVYMGINYEINVSEDTCQTKAGQPKLDIGAFITIAAFGAILLLVVVSTSYDTALYYLGKKSAHPILVAFSAVENGRKLLKTQSSNEISCLYGIRVVSTFWIILGHRYSIQTSFFTANSFYISDWLSSEGNMFMLSATIGVDTFLLLNGILLTYNYMFATIKQAKFNVLLHYFHRYIRLTPVIALVMVFHITLAKYAGSGPVWPNIIQNQLIDGCERHWWKTLLYIQNIFGRGKPMCISHTWYLSLDIQLFLLSPFLIVPLKRWPKLALLVMVSLAVGSSIANFCLAWFFELSAHMQGNELRGFEKTMDFVWLYYFPPHTRAGPWLVGLVFGYAIFETKQGRLKLITSKTANAFLWIVSLAVLFVCTFVGHNLISGDYNRLANSLHIALVRPVWAIAVACLILACASGFGGPVNQFLSFAPFQVLSKLTFTLYVLHYPIIYIITAQMRTIPMFGNFEEMYKFWGDLVCTLVASVILTLSVEFPINTVDTLLFPRKKL